MQEQEKPKLLGRLSGITGSISGMLQKGFRSIGMIIIIILGLMVVCVNLGIGYIMFAPDSMPKPFYLAYQNQPGSQVNPENKSGESNKQGTQSEPANSEKNQANQVVQPKAPSVPLEIKSGQGIMFDTGTKIVNLSDPSGRRYVKVDIILEYAPNDILYFLEQRNSSEASSSGGGEGGGEGAAAPTVSYADKFKAELETKRPLIDDTIITLLSSKTFEDVYTAAGKEKIRKEITMLLNNRMPEYRVIFVYFSEFTVQ